MEIHRIKINGVIEIDQPINPETEYSICLECIGNKDNNLKSRKDSLDNTVITYSMENKGKATLVEEGNIIAGKPAKKATMSQIWRLEVEKVDDYETFMSKMLTHRNEVISFIQSL